MTVSVYRLKVMFLNAAGSEIRNLISVLCLFSGEKLFPPMGLEGGLWKQREGEAEKMWDKESVCDGAKRLILNRDVWLPTVCVCVCACGHVHMCVLALHPSVFIKHITAPSRFLTCTPPACYIWPTNHRIRNHAYISIANGLPSPFNMQISWNITECRLF